MYWWDRSYLFSPIKCYYANVFLSQEDHTESKDPGPILGIH